MMKNNYLFRGYYVLVKSYILGLIAFLGVGLLLSIPMCLIWNWLMPFIFGLPKLNILQTFGLSILINMLTSKLDTNTETAREIAEVSKFPSYAKEYFELKKDIEEKFM